MRHPFSELSGEIARLQTELHSARLQEFEAQEQVTQLTTQLEDERALRQKSKSKFLIISRLAKRGKSTDSFLSQAKRKLTR